jgi:hypothetical protein
VKNDLGLNLSPLFISTYSDKGHLTVHISLPKILGFVAYNEFQRSRLGLIWIKTKGIKK